MAIHYKARTLALTLICCLLASPAIADDEGGYVALDVGNSGIGGHTYYATYCYQYTPMWAMEVSYGKEGYVSSSGFAGNARRLSGTGVATLLWLM